MAANVRKSVIHKKYVKDDNAQKSGSVANIDKKENQDKPKTVTGTKEVPQEIPKKITVILKMKEESEGTNSVIRKAKIKADMG